jgi:hypothetical protein
MGLLTIVESLVLRSVTLIFSTQMKIFIRYDTRSSKPTVLLHDFPFEVDRTKVNDINGEMARH